MLLEGQYVDFMAQLEGNDARDIFLGKNAQKVVKYFFELNTLNSFIRLGFDRKQDACATLGHFES